MSELLDRYAVLWVGAAIVVLVALTVMRARRIHRERLARLAQRRNGRLIEVPWFLPPRVQWELPGATLQISARSEDSESRQRGMRSFAYLACNEYSAPEMELRRVDSVGPQPERDGWRDPDTRAPEFDRVFRLRCDDRYAAQGLLDRELRQSLLAVPEELDIALHLGAFNAGCDDLVEGEGLEQRVEVSLRGVPADVAELERLFVLARGLHERLRAA